MGFELVKKNHFRGGLPADYISIRKTGFSFGETISKFLSKNGSHVKIYVDKETNRIGFEGTFDSVKGFSLQSTPKEKGVRVACRLAKDFKNGKYKADIDRDMAVISLETDNFKI